MNELSLFTGAGGGLLGTKLLGWNHIGYVEFNDYCQRVIRARIDDGIIDEAPIFGDIESFISEGYADSYQGLVDVITAGFPCQPFSVAGKGEAGNDPRNKWPETLECLRIIRPKFALLENVAGLFNHEYIRRIFGDLAESGFDCRWRIVSAADVGAPHLRKRVWILADSNRAANGREDNDRAIQSTSEAIKRETQGPNGKWGGSGFGNGCENVFNPFQHGLQGGSVSGEGSGTGQGIEQGSTPTGIYWATEPEVGRVAHGVASRVDRLKALGNGQVPAVAATAWRILNG